MASQAPPVQLWQLGMLGWTALVPKRPVLLSQVLQPQLQAVPQLQKQQGAQQERLVLQPWLCPKYPRLQQQEPQV